MRRLVLLVSIAAVMTIVLSGTVLADPLPANDKASCFGVLASSPLPGGPGSGISEIASDQQSTGEVASTLVPTLQQARPGCPDDIPEDVERLFPPPP